MLLSNAISNNYKLSDRDQQLLDNMSHMKQKHKQHKDTFSVFISTDVDDIIKIRLKETENKMEENYRKDIIQLHSTNHKIWWDNNKKHYRTYVPCAEQKRGIKIIAAATEERLYDKIIKWYEDGNDVPKTMAVCYDAWFEEHKIRLSNNTIVRYQSDYKRYFTTDEAGRVLFTLNIADITDKMLDEYFVNTIKKMGLCRKAFKTLFGYIRNTCNYAWRNKIICEDPCARFRLQDFTRFCKESARSKRKQTISQEDWDLIFQLIKKDEEKGYIEAFAAELASMTGMRVGELSALTWNNVYETEFLISDQCIMDRSNGNIYPDDVKNHQARFFPITDDIKDLFDRVAVMEKTLGTYGQFVFMRQGALIPPCIISSYIKNKCIQAGLSQTYGIHAIRKTVNSVTKSKGTSTMVAASVLGHDPAVNDKYYTKDVSQQAARKKAVEGMNLNSRFSSN